jgi:hypothetical protein
MDRRAWIVACLLVLLALGAYVIWVARPRAQYTARSLSAAGSQPGKIAQPVTKSLHVDGCNENFIVKPGELVEPRVVPGSTAEQFRTIYGKETKRDGSGNLSWEVRAFTLTDGDSGQGKPGDFVRLSLNQGHVVETLDGIELGIDSFGTIFHKMQDKKVEIHERMVRSEGKWTLIVSLYSACGRRYRSEYTRTLPASAELDRLILKQSTAAGQSPVWHSDVFMNKVVSEYTMVPSNGRDDAVEGNPSEHD